MQFGCAIMVHRRKPKVGLPPGLDDPASGGERGEHCLQELFTQLEGITASVELLGSKVQRLASFADALQAQKVIERLELLERVFLYVDWDKLE